MPEARSLAADRLLSKACLACGYRGRAIQGQRGRRLRRCPGCGADLYTRPPRSYAEMEGLVESDPEGSPVGPLRRVIDGAVSDEPASMRTLVVRALVLAALFVPPAFVVAAAGALVALWISRY